MILKRGNRYGVRIYINGRQLWVGTYAKKSEARDAERAALSKLHPTEDETCASFAARWVDDYPRPRSSTNRGNRYAVKGFGKHFGDRKLSSITRREARAWANQHQGAGLVVRAMFTDALNDELVMNNPFAGLRLERSRGRKDIVALSEHEVHDLADRALNLFEDYGPTFRAVVLFCAYVGLRPSEMFVLEWSDLTDTEVHIRRSLGGSGEVTLPKNGKHRTVVLPPPARDALRSMPRRADSPYVFTTSRGARFSKSSHYYYWHALRAAAGRPGMDFYELRHFCATHLLELGLSPSDVAVQLGHTDGGALVMSTYGHPSEDSARARLLAAYAAGPPLRLVRSEDTGDDHTDGGPAAASAA